MKYRILFYKDIQYFSLAIRHIRDIFKLCTRPFTKRFLSETVKIKIVIIVIEVRIVHPGEIYLYVVSVDDMCRVISGIYALTLEILIEPGIRVRPAGGNSTCRCDITAVYLLYLLVGIVVIEVGVVGYVFACVVIIADLILVARGRSIALDVITGRSHILSNDTTGFHGTCA